ncbi:MAG: DNA internalization-related competence protein ComEC/Rec2, partial [Gammaproteobacteria bacterium]|nr:DNA internalization-related competence protein ComEC/Rec2 [Gammaproteobacteria bacterium]
AINISRLRAALAADIEQIPALGNAGVLKALVVGDRDDISSAQWDLFTATGTNHLVVISGLHVGFVALCAWTLINRLSRRFPRLLLRVPAQHLAGYSAIMAAACYSLLAGFSLPTQRALIMITVLMASRISGRSVAPADSLAVAALLVLLMDPMAVTQAGFWLSFAAVASLFFAFVGYGQPLHQNRQSTIKTLWQRWVQPQWAVSVGLLLPLLLWTGQMSLNAPLANVFAIPLVSLLVVPLALVGAMMLSIDMTWTHAAAQFLLQQADRLLDWLQMFLVFISAWSPALWRPAVPSLLTMMLMALSSIVLLMPRGLAPRWLALPLLLPLIWPPPPARPPVGRVWLQFLDVGQGLAVVVHTRQHHLLFDTGPALGPDFDAGRAVILPYLYQSHVSYLDALIVSHWHADHSGGLNTVADNMAIGRRLAGPAQSSAANWYDDYRFEGCEAGQHWQWDDVHFTVLFPPADPSLAADGNVNNSSCVLLIEAGGQGVLLTGDIEEAAERRLLATHADLLDVDVLQAPHHGSRSSSSAAFVQATSPTWVVMSAGYRNRFDHPHSDIVERYQRHGAQVLFSADSGAVLMEIGGEKPVLLFRHRQQHRRFWFNL